MTSPYKNSFEDKSDALIVSGGAAPPGLRLCGGAVPGVPGMSNVVTSVHSFTPGLDRFTRSAGSTTE